jgi:hypothetical protein
MIPDGDYGAIVTLVDQEVFEAFNAIEVHECEQVFVAMKVEDDIRAEIS